MPPNQNCVSVTAECPVQASIYGYYPSLPINAFYCASFGLLALANIIIGTRTRTWTYMLALVLGCVGESTGYVGRILLHSNPFSNTGFEMQICCLILSPAFIAAAIYLTLKHVTLAFGPECSKIKPRFYTWIFICCDLVTLVLQACGGAVAATATTYSVQKIGNDLMMAGIVLQVVILLAFASAVTDFFLRLRRSAKTKPLSTEAQATWADRRFRLFAGAVLVAFTTIFIRCCYRIAEMAGGWSNPIMQNETDFVVLDGAVVLVATIALTVFHPGFCFPRLGSRWVSPYPVAGEKEVGSSEESLARAV